MEKISEKKLREMYRQMVLIREHEMTAAEKFSEGKIPGFVHLYAGEEAIAVGVMANLTKEDYITSTHRGHGHLIAKGADPKKMMAELYGKRTGYCKGKGGSMHICDMDKNILGANGIVGGGIPIATGAGLSIKERGEDAVVACFFGDGASNTTAFHESINLGSIWDVPVVYICENNQFAISMPSDESVSSENISDRAASFGIPGVTVDGNDVMAVYEATNEAVKRAKNGRGPSLIECETYRYRGHFEGDPQVYKTEAMQERWEAKDPIPRFRRELIARGVLTEEEAKQIKEDAEETLEEACEYADESPLPDPEETLEDVYA